MSNSEQKEERGIIKPIRCGYTMSNPRQWTAVISRSRQEGTIPDRNVQHEQNVEHIHVIEKSAYDHLVFEFKEFFMDFLNQGVGKYNRDKDRMDYDHMCLSTYENAVQYALEKGWINKEQILR